MSLELSSPDDDRGQVGIGTLIVFIAMVLVAAIAAGVLINTAGFLQSQAEETGEEATDEVSNQITVDNVVGVANVENTEVEEIDLTVRAGAGADPIDISDATLLYSDGDDFEEGDINDLDGVEVSGGEDGVIGNGEDTATVNLELAEITSNLDEGEDAEISITTADNAQAEEFVTAPDPLTDGTFTF